MVEQLPMRQVGRYFLDLEARGGRAVIVASRRPDALTLLAADTCPIHGAGTDVCSSAILLGYRVRDLLLRRDSGIRAELI